MGVKDLWKILEPAGRPISPEALQGLILGVDVSIWLNQAIKGARDRYGNEIPNAHLLVLFNRICKLLYYQIKPVFVFDGSTPSLKLQTLERRKKRRQEASKKASGLIGKRAIKILEAHVIQSITGQEISLPSISNQQVIEDDMFNLPTFPEEETKEKSPSEEDQESNISTMSLDPRFQSFRDDIETMDINSESFAALPPELQHDLLLEKKETEKYSHTHPSALPTQASDFSDYQLMKVMRRSHLSRKLDNVRKTLNTQQSASFGIAEGMSCEIETNRIISTEERRYILIRGKDLESSSQEESQGEEEVPKQEDTEISKTQEQSSRLVLKEANVLESEDNKSSDEDLQVTTPVLSEPLASNPVNDVVNVEIEKDRPQELLVNLIEDEDNTSPENLVNVQEKQHSYEEPVEGINLETLQPHSTSDNNQIESISTATTESRITRRPLVSNSEETSLSVKENKIIRETSTLIVDTTISSKAVSGRESSDSDIEFEDVTESTNKSIVTPQVSSVSVTPSEETERMKVSEVPELLVNEKDLQEALEEVQELIQLPSCEAERILVEETEDLRKKTVQQEKRAAGITSIMYKEAQELLQLFGLPYVESPTEAEAQCATLESLQLTQGTITDDNDVLLFGGNKVYRHVFSTNHDLEFYSSNDILSLLGLNRDKLIVLAYLLGSDYTEGLEGIGCVKAMEILQVYDGEGIEPLRKIWQWHIDAQANPGSTVNETNLQKKLRNLTFPTGFPNKVIQDAYLQPNVDLSKEEFEWGRPDLDLLRQYALSKFGWSQSDTDKTLLPVLKKANSVPSQQLSLTKYVGFGPSMLHKGPHKSQRMRNAVARLTGQLSSTEEITTKSPRGKRGRGKQMSRQRKRPLTEETPLNKETTAKRRRGKGRGNNKRQQLKQVTQPTQKTIDSSSSSSSSNED